MTTFYLGSHQPAWLGRPDMADVPLFVSHRTLENYVTLPRARGPWALDSGGFSELRMYGSWDRVPPETYVKAVYRYRDEIGGLDWAAIQDWMCEAAVINGGRMGPVTFAGTHLSVPEHQRLTVLSGVTLTHLAPDLPWRYVVQGDKAADYERHVEMYDRAGIDLTKQPVVGLGSVCRRQGTAEIGALVELLAGQYRLRLHGFGVKIEGLRRYGRHLTSADSLAWSYGARRDPPLPGCTSHKNCANCPIYALRWRQTVLAALKQSHTGPYQLAIDFAA